MFDPLFERAVNRLGGLLQTVTAHIVKPTMIAASDAFVFDAAELQRSTPVRTMKRYQPEAGRAITKQDEVFCQQSNLYRRTFRFHLPAYRARLVSEIRFLLSIALTDSPRMNSME